IRDFHVTGVQTCALPISVKERAACRSRLRAPMALPAASAKLSPVRQLSMDLRSQFAAGSRESNRNRSRVPLGRVQKTETSTRRRSEERRVGKEGGGGGRR